MNLLSLVGNIFEPFTKLVDNMHTSDEERLQLKNQLFEMQGKAFSQAQEYENQLLNAKATIITAEAQGGSWLQRSWRPITMLTFLILVVLNSLGLLAVPLAPEAWTLLQIGLGGYVVGRSAEKMAPKVSEMMRKDR